MSRYRTSEIRVRSLRCHLDLKDWLMLLHVSDGHHKFHRAVRGKWASIGTGRMLARYYSKRLLSIVFGLVCSLTMALEIELLTRIDGESYFRAVMRNLSRTTHYTYGPSCYLKVIFTLFLFIAPAYTTASRWSMPDCTSRHENLSCVQILMTAFPIKELPVSLKTFGFRNLSFVVCRLSLETLQTQI